MNLRRSTSLYTRFVLLDVVMIAVVVGGLVLIHELVGAMAAVGLYLHGHWTGSVR